jgi:hypothetical protein
MTPKEQEEEATGPVHCCQILLNLSGKSSHGKFEKKILPLSKCLVNQILQAPLIANDNS